MEKEVKIKVIETTQGYYDIIGAQGTIIHASLFFTEDDFIKDGKEEPKTQIEEFVQIMEDGKEEPKTQIEEFVQIMEATGKVIRESR